MIKKIILLLAIIGPFGLYFFYSWLLKLEKKKIPIVKLSITSIILLMVALGFLRFYGGFDPNTKYSPAKYEDGELKPAKKQIMKEELDNICEECKKEDESVSQNLIMYGYKFCESCRLSKTIFPI